MCAHIKTQVKNPKISYSGFTVDKIMLLHINFHKLALTGQFLHWLTLMDSLKEGSDQSKKIMNIA